MLEKRKIVTVLPRGWETVILWSISLLSFQEHIYVLVCIQIVTDSDVGWQLEISKYYELLLVALTTLILCQLQNFLTKEWVLNMIRAFSIIAWKGVCNSAAYSLVCSWKSSHNMLKNLSENMFEKSPNYFFYPPILKYIYYISIKGSHTMKNSCWSKKTIRT